MMNNHAIELDMKSPSTSVDADHQLNQTSPKPTTQYQGNSRRDGYVRSQAPRRLSATVTFMDAFQTQTNNEMEAEKKKMEISCGKRIKRKHEMVFVEPRRRSATVDSSHRQMLMEMELQEKKETHCGRRRIINQTVTSPDYSPYVLPLSNPPVVQDPLGGGGQKINKNRSSRGVSSVYTPSNVSNHQQEAEIPDVEGFRRFSKTLIQFDEANARGDLDSCLSICQDAIRFNPRLREARELIASVYLRSGNIDMARYHLCGELYDGPSQIQTVTELQKRRESGILVTGCSTDVTAEEILAHFAPLGRLMSFSLTENDAYNKSAVLQYKTCEEAERAILIHHGKYLYGPVTNVGFLGQSRERFNQLEADFLQKTAGYRVMVLNLPTGDRKQLHQKFSIIGQILSVSTFKGRSNTGGFYYYGFVFFAQEQLATNAVAALNNSPLGGKFITVSRYRPKAARGAY